MNTNLNTPYKNLNPDTIISAVESVGFLCDGSLHALNSYENRVYQVGIENFSPMIVKFYRPNRWSNDSILEEHQFAQELNDFEIPVASPWMTTAKETLHHYNEFRFALFPRWGGRALELDDVEQLEWMGRFIGRVHAVSANKRFQHRQQLNVATFGHTAYNFLIKNNFIPDYLLENYCKIVELLLERIENQFQNIGTIKNIRLHGDMHAGNILWDPRGPHIVDLDDCVMGPAIQDIWMLLAGDGALTETHLEHILHGYQQFNDFNYQELQLIEPLRSLRMLHYSGWIARRWEDPAFPISFPWFNTPSYWQEQVLNLNQQLNLLE
jgi:Ser/Thr protein kinase RdoA (MazF antagonist)